MKRRPKGVFFVKTLMNTLLFGLALANLTSSPASMRVADKAPETIKMTVIASAYTPRVEETDSTPDITASGRKIKEGMIAANFLPFGTKVKIGDSIYVVEDRMNRRYTNAVPAHIDIAFFSLTKARKFGRQTIEIEIFPDTHRLWDAVRITSPLVAVAG